MDQLTKNRFFSSVDAKMMSEKINEIFRRRQSRVAPIRGDSLIDRYNHGLVKTRSTVGEEISLPTLVEDRSLEARIAMYFYEYKKKVDSLDSRASETYRTKLRSLDFVVPETKITPKMDGAELRSLDFVVPEAKTNSKIDGTELKNHDFVVPEVKTTPQKIDSPELRNEPARRRRRFRALLSRCTDFSSRNTIRLVRPSSEEKSATEDNKMAKEGSDTDCETYVSSDESSSDKQSHSKKSKRGNIKTKARQNCRDGRRKATPSDVNQIKAWEEAANRLKEGYGVEGVDYNVVNGVIIPKLDLSFLDTPTPRVRRPKPLPVPKKRRGIFQRVKDFWNSFYCVCTCCCCCRTNIDCRTVNIC